MAELGNFFVTVGSKFDKAGFDKARAAINKVALAGIAMGGALAAAGLKAAQVAGVQEAAEFKLAAALKLSNNASGISIESLKDYASKLQGVTTVGDETSLKLMQLGLSMGISAEQIRGATKDSIALSKSLGIDLTASMKMIALAREGDYNMLQRYIPALKTATTQAEKEAIVNKTLADGFKIAQAERKTYLGQIEALKNQWGDFVEKVGSAVIPVITELIDLIQNNVLPALEGWIGDTENVEKVTNSLAFALKGIIKIGVGVVGVFDLIGNAIGIVGAAVLGLQTRNFGLIQESIKGFVELKDTVVKLGEKIRDVDKLTVESDAEKKGALTEAELAFFEADQELKNAGIEADETRKNTVLENDMAREENEQKFVKSMRERALKEQEERTKQRIILANQISQTIVDGLEAVANVEALTWRTGAEAFKESLKKRLSYFILQKTQELMAAKIVALAKAIFNSTTTFGAAAGQIGIIIGQFAGALGALRAIGSFEKGGIVPGLIGQPQLAVVHGGEEIIPTSGAGSARTIINVTVPPITSRRVADEYGDRIGESIMRKLRRNRKL